ncbi:MAG: RNA polymerase sigma-54 factor [Syntrophus sp. SKADARSKE-3]|nr:RNA polymerase sigma-54 factor [Syntrophus sp. SKADARSKE-3]
MAFELKQNLKLAQQLVMTPQLQQAIKLLQLSRLEMVDMVNQELEENPLLEESAIDEFPDESVPTENDTLMTLQGDEIKSIEHTSEITGEGDGREDFDWDNYLEDYGPVGTTYEKHDDDAPSWDNLLTKAPSLTDHLMWQLKLSLFSDLEMRIGEQIIGNIDQNGYLAATIEEIALQESVEPAVVEDVLAKIQTFDPPGIAARDLKECLLIQARMLGVNSEIIEKIICDHLKDLEIKNYAMIARKLKISLTDVMDAVSFIINMDPRPGASFQEERVQTIIPDVYVVKSGNDFKIMLNDDGLPRLRISNFYREIMAGLEGSKEGETGKRYIKERVQSATWLIKSIQQRQKTIFKVAESIVRFQREYFNNGISHLKPLVLRDVALDVEMHESTISRVVTNKYMQTPTGLYELKYFFSSGISTSGGEAIASKSVKEEIRKLVNDEDPRKPLSDSEIVERLSEAGINIARRTIAKYREMMNILPSSRRRKYF